MFDDFLLNCPMEDEIKPSQKRVEKNIAAVMSLIEKEEITLTKQKFKFKPLIIAAVIAIISGVLLLSVSAVIQTTTVSFLMGGNELDGEYYDYVDSEGFRQVSFSAVLPIDENNFAIIYDIDAPMGENVRVVTDETDPDFMDKLRMLFEARVKYWDEKTSSVTDDKVHVTAVEGVDSNYPQPEDFGLFFKDSELCHYNLSDGFAYASGSHGGKFMHTGAALGKPSGFHGGCTDYDYENGTKTLKQTFYYYVGKK